MVIALYEATFVHTLKSHLIIALENKNSQIFHKAKEIKISNVIIVCFSFTQLFLLRFDRSFTFIFTRHLSHDLPYAIKLI